MAAEISSLNILKAKRAAEILPVSYATLYRLASDSEGVYKDAFLYLGNSLCVDLDKFLEIGRKEARKRSLMR
jgi:hypothetical protein